MHNDGDASVNANLNGNSLAKFNIRLPKFFHVKSNSMNTSFEKSKERRFKTIDDIGKNDFINIQSNDPNVSFNKILGYFGEGSKATERNEKASSKVFTGRSRMNSVYQKIELIKKNLKPLDEIKGAAKIKFHSQLRTLDNSTIQSKFNKSSMPTSPCRKNIRDKSLLRSSNDTKIPFTNKGVETKAFKTIEVDYNVGTEPEVSRHQIAKTNNQMEQHNPKRTKNNSHNLNTAMKEYQSDFKIKELINSITSPGNYKLEYSLLFRNLYEKFESRGCKDFREKLLEYFLLNPTANSELKQVQLFGSILHLLLTYIVDLERNQSQVLTAKETQFNDSSQLNLQLLDALFEDFIVHLNVNSSQRGDFLKKIWLAKNKQIWKFIDLLNCQHEDTKMRLESLKKQNEMEIEKNKTLVKSKEMLNTNLVKSKEEVKYWFKKNDSKEQLIKTLEMKIEDLKAKNQSKDQFIDRIYHKLNNKLHPEQKKGIFVFFSKFSKKYDSSKMLVEEERDEQGNADEQLRSADDANETDKKSFERNLQEVNINAEETQNNSVIQERPENLKNEKSKRQTKASKTINFGQNEVIKSTALYSQVDLTSRRKTLLNHFTNKTPSLNEEDIGQGESGPTNKVAEVIGEEGSLDESSKEIFKTGLQKNTGQERNQKSQIQMSVSSSDASKAEIAELLAKKSIVKKKSKLDELQMTYLLDLREKRLKSFLLYERLKPLSEKNAEFKLKYKRQLENIKLDEEIIKQERSNIKKTGKKMNIYMAKGEIKGGLTSNSTSVAVQTIVTSSHLDTMSKEIFQDTFKLESFKIDNHINKLNRTLEDMFKLLKESPLLLTDLVGGSMGGAGITLSRKSIVSQTGKISISKKIEDVVNDSIGLTKKLFLDQSKIQEMLRALASDCDSLMVENESLKDNLDKTRLIVENLKEIFIEIFETIITNEEGMSQEIERFIEESKTKKMSHKATTEYLDKFLDQSKLSLNKDKKQLLLIIDSINLKNSEKIYQLITNDIFNQNSFIKATKVVSVSQILEEFHANGGRIDIPKRRPSTKRNTGTFSFDISDLSSTEGVNFNLIKINRVINAIYFKVCHLIYFKTHNTKLICENGGFIDYQELIYIYFKSIYGIESLTRKKIIEFLVSFRASLSDSTIQESLFKKLSFFNCLMKLRLSDSNEFFPDFITKHVFILIRNLKVYNCIIKTTKLEENFITYIHLKNLKEMLQISYFEETFNIKSNFDDEVGLNENNDEAKIGLGTHDFTKKGKAYSSGFQMFMSRLEEFIFKKKQTFTKNLREINVINFDDFLAFYKEELSILYEDYHKIFKNVYSALSLNPKVVKEGLNYFDYILVTSYVLNNHPYAYERLKNFFYKNKNSEEVIDMITLENLACNYNLFEIGPYYKNFQKISDIEIKETMNNFTDNINRYSEISELDSISKRFQYVKEHRDYITFRPKLQSLMKLTEELKKKISNNTNNICDTKTLWTCFRILDECSKEIYIKLKTKVYTDDFDFMFEEFRKFFREKDEIDFGTGYIIDYLNEKYL